MMKPVSKKILLALLFHYSGRTNIEEAAREGGVSIGKLERFIVDNGLWFRLEESSVEGAEAVADLLAAEGVDLKSLSTIARNMWWHDLARYLGVGEKIVRRTAERLNLTLKTRKWSEKEIKVLVELYPTKKFNEVLARLPGRNEWGVRSKVKDLHGKGVLGYKSEKWTDERIKLFSKMWNSKILSIKIGEKFGLTVNSVYCQRQKLKLKPRHPARKLPLLPAEQRQQVENLLKTGLTVRQASEKTGVKIEQAYSVNSHIGFDGLVSERINMIADKLNVPEPIKQAAKERATNLIMMIREKRIIRLVATEVPAMALWLACNDAGFPLAMAEISITAGWKPNDLYCKLHRITEAGSMAQSKSNYATFLPCFTVRLPNDYWLSPEHKQQVEAEATLIFSKFEGNRTIHEKLRSKALNAIIASVICIADENIRKPPFYSRSEKQRIKSVFKTFNCPKSNASRYYVNNILKILAEKTRSPTETMGNYLEAAKLKQ